MSRNGSGVYTLPAGTAVANGDLSDASDVNVPFTDLETDMNTARPVVAGGTGATTALSARENLGVPATVSDKSGAYTAVAADRATTIRGTAAFTLSLTAAATLGDGWFVDVNADSGDITIDPDGSETINGETTYTLIEGASGRVVCDGTSFYMQFTGDVFEYSPSYRNKVINGDFLTWQRGTSQTSDGYGSADSWKNEHSGTTKTASRQTFTLGQTDVPGNPTYYMRHVVTTSAGAANYCWASHKIKNVATFSNQNCTLSFWAKADSAKDIAVDLAQRFGASGSATVEGIGAQKFTLSTSWQKFTATIAVPDVTGKTLGTTVPHVALTFWFDAGSDYNSRTDTLGQQSGTFDIALVQLEPGSAATAFEHLEESASRHRCFERFIRFKGDGTNQSYFASGFSVTTTKGVLITTFPVPMIQTPSPAYGGTVYVYDASGGGDAISSIASSLCPAPHQVCQINVNTSGKTVGQGALAFTDTAATDYFEFDAEINA